MPICPICGETMVRTYIQLDYNEWIVCWSCGCEPTEYEITQIEEEFGLDDFEDRGDEVN